MKKGQESMVIADRARINRIEVNGNYSGEFHREQEFELQSEQSWCPIFVSVSLFKIKLLHGDIQHLSKGK